MALSFGNGVSRTLAAAMRQFSTVVWQAGKPPLDAELNLLQQIQSESLAQTLRSQIPSGFFTDPTRALGDYVTAPEWSNFFLLGNPAEDEGSSVVWASINGWVLPVIGTQVNVLGDPSNLISNVIRLNPPPASDSRFDFVFLEAWSAVVAPNPSTLNKPAADKVWAYGNVEYGSTNIDDDLEDPSIGVETTHRVQVQYRIRVFGQGSGLGTSVSLDVYPDGLDDPNILGQGTSDDPVAGFPFENMRDELGDASLWRAGDGSSDNLLGTTDGYTYAIPICAIPRRNSSSFVAVSGSGDPNHNGSLDRQPSADLLSDPREAARVLNTPTLVSALTAGTTGSVQVNNLINSGLDDSEINLTSTFIAVDDEVLDISAVDTSTSPATITIAERGVAGTQDTLHAEGAEIRFYNTRPDGLFSDEVDRSRDIYDLRRSVNLGDWDYQRLLLHNLSELITGQLRTTYKKGAASDSQGVSVVEVGYLHANRDSGFSLNQTEELDGPDGIRWVFSDAATPQGDVTVLCDQEAALSGGYTTNQFDTNNSTSWSVGAEFLPSGFINNLSPSGGSGNGWTDGSVLFLHVGGSDGTQGARRTFRDGSTKAVRFVGPREYWKGAEDDPQLGRQHPITLRFLGEDANRPAAEGETGTEHPGPLYPLKSSNFEHPFIVLGGILHPTLVASGLTGDVDSTGGQGLRPLAASGREGPEIDLGSGFDFDDPGVFFPSSGDVTDTESTIGVRLLNDTRTLYDMLTDFGRDRTGNSSEVYVVLYGDTNTKANNGAFKVVGAGTVGYTTRSASNSTSLVVEPLSEGVSDFDSTPTSTEIVLQFRSQYTTTEDGDGFGNNDGNTAALSIVLTGLKGETGGETNPWNFTELGSNAIGTPYDGNSRPVVTSQMVVNSTLLYNPGRSGTARVPNEIMQVAVRSAGSTYLRQALSARDPAFPPTVGLPTGETYFDRANVQLWNRLPSLGLTESSLPKAPSFGGRVVASSEQDRENEVFLDKGSKTVVFRPFQNKPMTIRGLNTAASPSLVGSVNYPAGHSKDSAAIFTSNLTLGYPVPSEYMPRFGRQDIPYYEDVDSDGSGTFLDGINHLFGDTVDPTSPVFHLIGGQDNGSGGNLVLPMYFQTGSQSLTGLEYTVYGTITGPGTPAYQARLTSDISNLTTTGQSLLDRLNAVVSSDLGAGLDGIQLPPYHGIARLYGVYDRQDFIDKGGATFLSDRVTPDGDPATNLLRKDADRQTLFIFRDGAEDVTQSTGDHTYIIPSNAIDLSLSPYYAEGSKDQFSDFDFVVEAAVFGFARGFINENNYVLARRHNGEGDLITDGSPPAALENVRMAIPAAAPEGDQVYVLYRRTPYQGDPFMTREGETRTTTDYEARYGQVSQADAFELATPIEQYNSAGEIQVETPNPRPLQVLASVDFVTSLGTGKVGGETFPGTVLDVGHVEDSPDASTRIPDSASQLPWTIKTRAYTEGQRENTNRAQLDLDIINSGAALTSGPATVTIVSPSEEVTFTAVSGAPATDTEFDASGTPDATAASLASQIRNHPLLYNRVVSAFDVASRVTVVAIPVGAAGNDIRVEVEGLQTAGDIEVITATRGDKFFNAVRTAGNLSGGEDIRVNAGNGFTPLFLTGMTERLPLGILLQDADFIGENPLGDNASAFSATPGVLRPIQSVLPLTESGDEYTRFLGSPGQLVSMSDGAVLRYSPFDNEDSPSGTKRFRLYRGGGALFVLSGSNPGGPLDWLSQSFPASSQPVLKGGMLACKALLVRNFREEAFSTDTKVSDGDELQMVVLTYGVLGNGRTRQEGVSLEGVISPTGYGEGYAAADRFRLEGKPMSSGFARTTADPEEVSLAPFPGRPDQD